MYRIIADTLITAGVAVFIVCGLEDSWRAFRRWEVLHRG
jgi:hypothetical protein